MTEHTFKVILVVLTCWLGLCILACVVLLALTHLWEESQHMSGPIPSHEDIDE